MASLHRKPNGQYYIVYRAPFYDQKKGGKSSRQVWLHTGTKDQAEAKAALRKFKSSGRVAALAFNDLRFLDLTTWIRSFKATDTKSYEKTYKYAIGKLETEFGDCYLSNITKERLSEWETKMRAKGLGNSSVHKYAALLRHIFRLAIDHDKYGGKNPFVGYHLPPENKPRGVILTPDQQAKLLLACFNPDRPLRKRQTHPLVLQPETLRDIVEVGLAYGLRLGEIIGVNQRVSGAREATFVKTGGLRVGDLDPSTNLLRFRRTKVKERSKGIRSTTIRVTTRIATILNKHSEGKQVGQMVFTNHGMPIFTIQKAFNDAVAEAHLRLFDDEGTPVKKLQFRDLRPTAASNMLDFGLGETEISKMLGHVDTRMASYVYLRKVQDQTMLNAAEKIERGLRERQPPIP